MDPSSAAWLVVCSVLVLLMAPALALFYRGSARATSVKSILVRWGIAVPILSVQWLLFGYSLAFGPTRHGLIGSLAYAGMMGGTASGVNGAHGALPALAFATSRMVFAVVAPALISGALGARMKLSAYVAFVLFWSTLVYDPIAHWVWGGGWLARLGVLDFAGGLVVHLTTGISAVVCAVVIGKGASAVDRRMPARDPTAALIGAGVLWLGWFAFSAAAALTSGSVLALAFMTTQLGAAGGGLSWLIIEWSQRGKPTAMGAASGVVSGLVAMTPAAGFVAPSAAIAIGVIAGAIGYGTGLGVASGLVAGLLAITAAAGHVEPAMAIAIACMAGGICHAAVLLKGRFGSARSPDPFGVQGVGGIAGALMTGVFAQKALNAAGANGALFGNVSLLAIQAIACLTTGIYAAGVTFVILKLVDATLGLRVLEAPTEESQASLPARSPV